MTSREYREALARRMAQIANDEPPMTYEQRELIKARWQEMAQWEPKPLQPSSAFVSRRINRWTPVQVGIYILVPVLTLIGYALGLAWCWERYS